MKYLLAGLLLAAGVSGVEASTSKASVQEVYLHQKDSITLETLVAMNKKQFKGKPIGEFLASKEAQGYTDLIFRHTEEGQLQGLRVKYSDSLYLNVYVSEYKNLVPFNPDKQWKLEDLKKETIEEIRVVYVMHD